MPWIITAAGIVGSLILGVDGMIRGSEGELSRIFAIACFFMAAAGFLGIAFDASSSDSPSRVRPSIVIADVLSAIAIAPIVIVCTGVFLLTLVPSMFLMLPAFLRWSFEAPKEGDFDFSEHHDHAHAYA